MSCLTERTLGRSALGLTALSFGGSVIGNLHRPVPEDDALAAVAAAYESGIRYFDTAPLYGGGLGEHRIGRVLRTYPRESFVLSTKVGVMLKPLARNDPAAAHSEERLPFEAVYDYGYDATLRSLEDSLQRLGLSRVDIALIHDIDPDTHGREGQVLRFREAMAGAYPALERLRAEGVISAIGVGVNDWRVCVDCAEAGDFDCFLLAGRYSLLEQEPLHGLLPLCQARNIGVIVGAPYNSGILARGAVQGATHNYRPPAASVQHRVREMERVCAAHGVSLAAAALRFPLGHPAVAAVLPGARSPAQVARNLACFDESIPPELWQDLKGRKLIDRAAPCP